ncbi:MAG TPA: pilus assembly protein PilP [Kofleriaceae bacterium]|jgi:Tfp pilus assembly protein PilP
MRRLALILLALAACGDDGGAGGPGSAKGPAVPAGAAGAGSGSGVKNPMKTMVHVEDRVLCVPPQKATGKACDLKLSATMPVCEDLDHPEVHLYCLPLLGGQAGQGSCEACPERESIRHAFKERDFAPDQNRDPFQSFVVNQPGLGQTTGDLPKDVTKKCLRDDQMKATAYGFDDLKLVGIVAEGSQRVALMMDPSNHGQHIHRGDCVGKEKAVVKDIGVGYITFALDPETAASSATHSTEKSVMLHPKQLDISGLPSDQPLPTSPVMAPAAPTVMPAPIQPASGGSRTPTTIAPAAPPATFIHP